MFTVSIIAKANRETKDEKQTPKEQRINDDNCKKRN